MKCKVEIAISTLLNQVNTTNKEHKMITENDEYIECLDKLNAINYLIDSTALATTGDDVKYAKEALTFLSNNMHEALQGLENIILNHLKKSSSK